MAKSPLQDIVMPSQRKKTSAGIQSPPQEPPVEKSSKTAPRPPRKSNLTKWLIILGVLAVLVVAFTFLFSGVSVKVTPKQERVFIDGSFSAVQEGVGFTYEVMSLDKTRSKKVAATDEEDAEVRASGQIIVYNNYNSQSQRLIKNTRFETPEGKIFRIQDSVVVPGQRTEGGETVPGSLEVTVYADEPGEGYNIGLTDFTIPGFEGSDRFDGFYARSKTPMTGGFVGKRLVVSEETSEATRVELQNELRNELLGTASSQIPEGFILYEDGISFEFESLPNIDGEKETEVRERGIMHAIIFEEAAFARYLAESTIANYDNNAVYISNPDELSVSFVRSAGQRLWEEPIVNFDINGTAHIVWSFNMATLQADLAGRSKQALPEVLSQYAGIQEAKAFIRPFWQNTFPNEPSDIKIETVFITEDQN